MSRPTRLGECRLQLLVTRALCRGAWQDVVRAAVRGGVDLLQIREKGTGTRELVAFARQILEEVPDVPVLINDDLEAARQLPVQGVHLGQADRPAAEARRLLGEEAWIGVSTHSRDELAQALAGPATHVGLGACFKTATKQGACVLLREVLQAALMNSPRPVFAIGGITPDNLSELLPLGVRRIAVSSCILQSDDPEATSARLRTLLDKP